MAAMRLTNLIKGLTPWSFPLHLGCAQAERILDVLLNLGLWLAREFGSRSVVKFPPT